MRARLRQVTRLDLALAVALLASGIPMALVGERATSAPVAVLLVTLYSLPLALRRPFPLPASTACVGVVLLYSKVDPVNHIATIPLALAYAGYIAGAGTDPPRTWLAAALLIGSLALVALPGERLGVSLLVGVPLAFGQALRARARQTEALAREAVREERQRIARELHDVVAHSISVVGLQVQVVRRRLRPDQAAEAADLAAVETTIRQAMAEMRRLFGVLRAEDDEAALAPQPGLAELDRLVEQTRAAGLPVELTVEGERAPLPPGVDLAAYRIVQEALTNVRRHAGAHTARVALRFAPDHLELCVDDDGRGGGHGAGGHGLVGMRERVALYGGRLEVGPRAGGGFRVRAWLPVREGASA